MNYADRESRRTASNALLRGQSYTTTKIFVNLAAGQFSNYPNGNSANTHFQAKGAKIISTLVTDGLRADPHSPMRTFATHLN